MSEYTERRDIFNSALDYVLLQQMSVFSGISEPHKLIRCVGQRVVVPDSDFQGKGTS